MPSAAATGNIDAIPRATYRLQFNAEFTFADAERIVPYLADLGISHIYASPFVRARSGSTHGYDITDHNALNPEIGDEAAFNAFIAALHARGMGLILDFVPNHMGIGMGDNAWWLDVLAWGQSSPFAGFFDINWRPAKAALRGKVLVPLLGEHYGAVLEQGQLALEFDAERGSFHVSYFAHVFPIAPRHYARILVAALREWPQEDRETIAAATELAREFMAVGGSRPRVRGPGAARARAAELMQSLAAAAREQPSLRRYIDACLRYFNGTPGDAASFMALHRLLERQAYRLAYWRVAADEINYRRFFDVNELAGLRVEEPALFELIHRRVHEWIESGTIQGLRIDHIDGLFDPANYCRRLRELAGGEPFYIVVEKILGAGERLSTDWPVDGTTGYELINLINGLFVDPDGRRRILAAYRTRTGLTHDFAEELAAAKRQVMDALLAGELQVLADELDRIAESNWRTRDFTRNDMVRVLVAAVTMLPVYRTYVGPRGASVEDRRIIERTIAAAHRANPGIDASLLEFLRAVWTTDLVRRPRPGYSRRQVVTCAMKLQQFTGPVMAKAMEDTAFYRYVPLVSLNEVGGEPDRFGISVEEFHTANQRRLRDWPNSMIATTTHDSKRGEDVRARIDVLSELPDEWHRRATRWVALNRRHRTMVGGLRAPTARDEYLLYQTLIGAWPIEDIANGDGAPRLPHDFVGRIREYMTKAMREAKQQTSWVDSNLDYEEAVGGFIAAILGGGASNPFLADIRRFADKVARLGMLNSLGQTALKLTLPGVPDFYQGSELWELRLVDPDNRTPVDFRARSYMLAALRNETGPPISPERWLDGSVKLSLIARLLQHRRNHALLYREGGYVPLPVAGPAASHVCAFTRYSDDRAIVVCVARLLASAAQPRANGVPMPGAEFWGDTRIPLTAGPGGEGFRDIISGRTVATLRDNGSRAVAAEHVFSEFPVAVLAV